MKNEDIEKYIYERKANNYINSIHTERAYRIKIKAWLKFCKGAETIENAQKYRDLLSLKHNSPLLVRPTLYVLGSFYDVMGQDNPFAKIIKDYRVPKSEIVLKRIERNEKKLSHEEIQDMINVAQNLIKKQTLPNKIYVAQRNYLILMMLYRYGMRINSLVNIEMSHIDFEKNKIIMYKSKTIPYPIPISPIENDLKIFINQRNHYFTNERFKESGNEPDKKYLFTTETGRILSDMVARNSLNLISKKAGTYVKGRSTHQLRHFRATQNYKDSMSMDLISKIMGVSEGTLKDVYLHINTDDIIEQYERWAKIAKGFVCPGCGYSEQVQKEKKVKRERFKVIK